MTLIPAPDAPRVDAIRSADSFALALKTATTENHVRAERHPIQAAIVSGRITRAAYGRLVAQNRHVHEAMERGFEMASGSEPRLATMFVPHHRRLANYDADLAVLGVADAHRAPLPAAHAATAWIGSLASSAPIALLGVLYVIEGSTNGGQFLSRVLGKAFAVEKNAGLSSLDPHGGHTRERWGAFRVALDGLTLSASARELIIAAARETFDRIGAVMSDVAAASEII
jgi:heme oxygenase